MLQTSAVQRMGGGRIRDHRAAVLHDPEVPERAPSFRDADHRQDRSQLVQTLLGVSQDNPSTEKSISTQSRSGKFLRFKWLRSPAR